MNVVFDFGGVVFRWKPHEFMARLLPQHAPDDAATQRLVRYFFQEFGGEWGEFDRGTIGIGPLAEGIASRTGIELADVHRVIAAVPMELQPVPQTVALMKRLRERGHRLFFLSNMPASYADHLESTNAFFEWFEDGVFSSRVQLIKPEPAIYHSAAERFGVEPAELLFFDDHRPNIEAARASGWKALHFVSPERCEADLVAHGLL